MSELEQKLAAVMNDPAMMQQVMSLAQSLQAGQSQAGHPQESSPQNSIPSLPEFDPSMLQKLSGLAGQNSIDKNQRSLLHALGPYLSRERIGKLEKAMRAAKMAGLASSVLGSSGLPFLSGR